jgi:nucleotide-binding universal stress UspA family protein
VTAKIKNILVAIDFSENSDFALSRAIELARKNNARLTVLHVIEKKNMDIFLDNTLDKLLPKGLWLKTEEYLESRLQEKIQLFSSRGMVMDHEVIPRGKPAVKILQYAKRNKTDLLIIGAHGKYSLRDTFVGTTAEYIAERTGCPVLVVKNNPQSFYQNILVPTDFSDASRKALGLSIMLFQRAKVRMLHVGDYEYEELLKREEEEEKMSVSKLREIKKAILQYLDNRMQKFIKSFRSSKLLKAQYKIILGQPGPEIIADAQKFKHDLIVMGTRGHGRLHYLFIGGVASRVLSETDKDILLVPPK